MALGQQDLRRYRELPNLPRALVYPGFHIPGWRHFPLEISRDPEPAESIFQESSGNYSSLPRLGIPASANGYLADVRLLFAADPLRLLGSKTMGVEISVLHQR